MLKLLFSSCCFIILISFQYCFGAYGTITPESLHAKLIADDTLLILDVREWSEYTAGHIAEPAGQLPLTPACMPWNSQALRANHSGLPKDIDIIVHCASGGRSALASAFLDSLGFTRIFNMTGGFNAWTFEKRTGGFGDGSGHWIRPTITVPDTITHDSGTVVFYPASVSGMDSLYCEIHFAYGKQAVPGDAPASDIAGLFRITALNRFGMTLFNNDSLVLADSAEITLVPRSKTGGPLPTLEQTDVTALTGPGQWKPLAFSYQFPAFHGNQRVLRQWCNAAGVVPTAVQKQPVSVAHNLDAAGSVGTVMTYDLRGRLITKNYYAGLVPVTTASAYYIINTPNESRYGTPGIGLRSTAPSFLHRP